MMYYPVAHNSPEWFECRRGMPTSSCFGQIINPETAMKDLAKVQGAMDIQNGVKSIEEVAKELSVTENTVKGYVKKFGLETELPEPDLLAGAETYAHLLLAEIIEGTSLDKFPQTYWMERGAMMEEEAARLYEFETGYKVDRGGFITDDEMKAGCSPDRRILDKSGNVIGALEIKCPAPWTHVENLLKKEIDKQYNPQVQGQMAVGEFQFVDWFSYHPNMPPSLITTKRDEPYIDILKLGINKFDKMMKDKAKQLVEIGALPEMPTKVMPEIKDGVQDLIDGKTGEILMAG